MGRTEQVARLSLRLPLLLGAALAALCVQLPVKSFQLLGCCLLLGFDVLPSSCSAGLQPPHGLQTRQLIRSTSRR